MATYQAKSTNGLSFEVSKDSEVIGQLTYGSWFKFNAVITIADTAYPVEPKGFWGTSIEVRRGEQVLLSFSMGWKGQIVLQTYFSDAREGYVFDHRGVFRESFVLTDQDGKELLEAAHGKDILILTALHCANYYLSMTMATMGT